MIKPDRVASRLSDLGITRWEAAAKGGFERTFVNDILVGRKRKLHPRNIVALASVLECSPEYLNGEQDEIGSRPAAEAAAIEVQDRVVRYGGVIESGAIRRPTSDGTNPVIATVSDARYSQARQLCFICADDALSKLHIMRGDILVGAEYDDYLPLYGALRHGMIVVLELDHGPEGRELIARQISVDDEGHMEAHPVGTHNGYSHISLDQPGNDARIIAIVTKTVRLL